MKKTLTLVVVLLLILGLTACNVQTESQQQQPAPAPSGGETPTEGGGAVTVERVPLRLLYMSYQEPVVNVVQDMLNKNGFDVTLNTQPDYASFKAQEDAGNYDISMSGWTTVTGNPDYAVRSLFITGGDYSKLADPALDALIDQAALETADVYVDTYKQFEKVLVEDNAYIIPLYTGIKAQAFNETMLKADSVRLSKSRAFVWEEVEYNDASLHETRPLVLQQMLGSLTSLDPIKGNDGSINQLNTNMYVRLVNLTDDDQVVSRSSLSYNHAIAEGNSEYYFLLRDDINFAKVENMEPVDTGVLVGAEDVVFSLLRAADPNAVPDHRTFSLHSHIANVEIVDNLESLSDVKVSGSDELITDALSKDLPAAITTLVTDKADVDNASGAYQLVKLTTTEPFPQVLNYLAHQSAGIVSKDQVESINTYDMATFDITKDVPYGDQRVITEGDTYDNHLWTSGPYALIKKNDYGAEFTASPAYRPGDPEAAVIKHVTMRFIPDLASAVSALRAGEVDLVYNPPEVQFSIIEDDPNLTLQMMKSNAVNYMSIDMLGESEFAKSADLRKAVLYSINQEELIAALGGYSFPAYTTLTPLIDTGNVVTADPAKVQEHLQKYFSQKQ
jgi:peptide/nickel transport system substrate-binding protein